MDCTYKTNKVSIGQSMITGCYTGGTDLGKLGFPYSRPLVVNTNTFKKTTFPIAFGLVSSQGEEAYQWAANWLLQHSEDPSVIKVILIDREIALINALDSALPTAQTLICV